MSHLYGKRKTDRDARKHIAKSHREFRQLVQRRIKELNVDDKDRQRFEALLGDAPISGELRHSDLGAHERFAKFVASEVRHLRQTSEDLAFFHLTLLADEGIASDRKPMVALTSLKRKADKAMRKAGLEGIFRIEVQGLMNWPQEGKGRSLLCHVHILGWRRSPSHGDLESQIKSDLGSAKRRSHQAWSCRFGADPINVLSITDEKGCPSFWAAYILKAPYEAKNLVQPSEGATEHARQRPRLMSTTAGYRPEFGMRLFELFGQLGIFAKVGGSRQWCRHSSTLPQPADALG